MLTIIGTLLGLLGSIFPEILKYFTQKSDHLHEREMFKLQMEGVKLQGDIKIMELNATADIEETKALYESAKIQPSGGGFFDSLMNLYSSTVRPTITYLFMGMYIYVKYSTIQIWTSQGVSAKEALVATWSSDDFAVFSTIMAFWFGGRFLKWSMSRTKVPAGIWKK
jgi:hypothetical protein